MMQIHSKSTARGSDGSLEVLPTNRPSQRLIVYAVEVEHNILHLIPKIGCGRSMTPYWSVLLKNTLLGKVLQTSLP